MAESLTDATLPKGAKKILLPQGAKVIEEEPSEEKGFSFERDIAGQLVGGLQDITTLIAKPLSSKSMILVDCFIPESTRSLNMLL